MSKVKELRIGIFKIVPCHVLPQDWACKVFVDDYCALTTCKYSTENNAIYAAVKWVENTLAEATDAIKQPIFKPRCNVHTVRWFGEPLEGISEVKTQLDPVSGARQEGYFCYHGTRINKGDWIVLFNEQETVMSPEDFAELFVAGA